MKTDKISRVQKSMFRAYKRSRSLLAYCVSNLSQRQFRYSFQAAAVQKIHPLRELSKGTDRLIVTPNLLAMADHGNQNLQNPIANQDDVFSTSLLAVIKSFFMHQPINYSQDIFKLVSEAVQKTKQNGSCTLTVCTMHPYTGDISFYYIGDTLYGIFKEDKVEMVEGLYQEFNRGIKIGCNEEYTASAGFVEKFSKDKIKKDDIIVIGSNGLWNNVELNVLHNQVRGPGSLIPDKTKKYKDAVGGNQPRESRSLQEIAERVGSVAMFLSRKGNYESPVFKQAKKQNIQYPKEGFLDDVSVIVARRKKEIVIKRQSNAQAEN